MRKRRILLICAIAVGVVVIAFLAHRPSTPEPSYNGQTLSYWVALLGNPRAAATEQHEEATKAVDQIGAAALPFLVKWIQFNPPQWKRTLGFELARTRFGPVQKLARLAYDPTLANGTELSFPILGPRAMPAFDDLCGLMNNTNMQIAIPAARALACLGTNALPLFLAAVTNTHHPVHIVALESIKRIPDLGPTAQQVVPVVVTSLSPTNKLADQVEVILILGKFNAAPEISVPALASALQSTNSTVRGLSANTLGTFEAQAAAAIPALTNVAMADPDSLVRRQASNALNRIDPQSFPSPYGH